MRRSRWSLGHSGPHGPGYAAWIVFQEQWEVPAGFTSWLLWFAFGASVSLILLLSRVNDAQFSLSQGNAWISGGLEPSILCCHCPFPVSPPSVLALSENPSSFLTEGHSWNLGDQIRKRHPLWDGKQQESSWSGSVPFLVAASQDRSECVAAGVIMSSARQGSVPRNVST